MYTPVLLYKSGVKGYIFHGNVILMEKSIKNDNHECTDSLMKICPEGGNEEKKSLKTDFT